MAMGARDYAPGIGQAVADRTVNRKITETHIKPKRRRFKLPRIDDEALDKQLAAWAKSKGYRWDGEYKVTHGDGKTVQGYILSTGRIRSERWGEVAERVARGNVLLLRDYLERKKEFGAELTEHEARMLAHEEDRLRFHLAHANTLLSGRHLQHGDETQPSRNMELLTNCSTSAVSHLLFYLLLNGSGVGRAYDDDMMVVDWRNAPTIVPVIDMNHPDAQSGEIEVMDLRTAQHLYADQEQIVFEVPDSREGWAKAIEMMETLAWEGVHKDKVLLLDFSKVRERGAPIGGMQGRPASGPGPLMKAIEKIARIPFTMMAPWRQAMFIDHFLAECVLVGGARRAARMATKYWKDATVFDFIALKRGGFLWSSNNSVVTDGEFWDLVHAVRGWLRDDVKAVDAVDSAIIAKFGDLACHAWRVFNAVMDAAYNDMTGEPGFINGHKLTANDNDLEQYLDGKFAESERYSQETATHRMMAELARIVIDKPYRYITNPCGEIVLFVLGGYCVIGDVVPYHAADLDQAEEAFRVTTRALMRTNLMNSLYQKEVARTNRIGVSMTGVHEFALAHFGYGWKDIVNEEKSKDFWLTLSRFKRAVKDEARRYADFLGVVVPHTDTTIKPAGTTSKLFGLSEGAHLPAMREYLRWVQFRNDDPLVKTYEDMGYPVKRLRTYSGTTVVGFPTRPTICTIEGADEKVVTASEATMAEQFEYLRLLEKYWIVGVEEDGVTPLSDTGNQVSYTLKYDPQVVSFEAFKEAIIDNQPTVRCCSVMPKVDMTAFEYQPEEPVTKGAYEKIAAAIANDDAEDVTEDIGMEHVDCGGGACPIDFNSDEEEAA